MGTSDPYLELLDVATRRAAATAEVKRLDGELEALRRREPRLRWDGDHVRDLRRARGLSQTMVARIAGVAPSTVRRYERNGCGPHFALPAWRVALALGVTLGEFAEGGNRGTRVMQEAWQMANPPVNSR